MKTFKIFVNGDLVGIKELTAEEVRQLNSCEEIRIISTK